MSVSSEYQRRLAGSLLVVVQFGLLLWLGVMALPDLSQARISVPCVLLLLLSAALGAWTLLHNRLGNFNIHPEPKASGVLVTTGPYRWMRHPMYTTVLLTAAALACLSGSTMAWLLWTLLFGVLLAKSAMEEHWLHTHHPHYQTYRRQRKRFVPWLF